MKTRSLSILGALLVVGALAATVRPALALDPYGVPDLFCSSDQTTQARIELKICGDEITGAPAGVTVQYKKLSDWQVSGWADDGTLCKLSLSGQPSLKHPGKSRWELLPGECETINIGEINFDETGVSGDNCPLECGTDYVFRTFAHAGRGFGRSDFSDDLICSTLPCTPGGCTLTQGAYKTSGPAPCDVGGDGRNRWPVGLTSLTLGTVSYSLTELCAILQEPAAGNGLLILAHQLITAKFNVLNGADGSCIAAQIAAADALIGGLVVPPGGSGFLKPGVTSSLSDALAMYNEGKSDCADHCQKQQNGAQNGAKGTQTTWGKLKTIYR